MEDLIKVKIIGGNMKEVIIFGCGAAMQYALDVLEQFYKILFICDNDAKKWNAKFILQKGV